MRKAPETDHRTINIKVARLSLFALGVLASSASCGGDRDSGGGRSGSAGENAVAGAPSGGRTSQAGAPMTSAGASSPGGGSGTAGAPAAGGAAGNSGSPGTSGSGGSPGSAGNPASAGTGDGAGAGGRGGAGAAGAPGRGGSGGSGNPGEPAVRYIGRMDLSDAAGPRFAWSGSGVVARFQGTSVSASFLGGQQYTVVIDGMLRPKLVPAQGASVLASGLSDGEHVVEVYRRTEANQGESQFLGFDFGAGRLLAPPPAAARRLEIIGDSITCGYGNEGPDQNCPFTPDTENHYLAYGAIAARNVDAELVTVAWSGKGVVCNYGDGAASCTEPLPTFYERTLPQRAGSQWDFTAYQPDAVVINLGTNDFSTVEDPSQQMFETGYENLLKLVRSKYPNAYILCTVAPLLSGTDLTTARTYIDNVVRKLNAAGDAEIKSFTLGATMSSEGFGCDWHPSLATHERLATELTAVLESTLGW